MTDKWTDRQWAYKETGMWRDSQSDRPADTVDRPLNVLADRQTDRQVNRQTGRQTSEQIDRQTDGWTDRQ